MNHQDLKAKCHKAIEELYSDMSVPPETTKDDLEEIIEEMQVKIEALEQDMKRK